MRLRRENRPRLITAAAGAVVVVSGVLAPTAARAAAGEIFAFAGKTEGIVHGDWISHAVGGYDGDGGPAVEAHLNRPGDIAFDGVGVAFIADTRNDALRRVDGSGRIDTLVRVGVPVALAVGPDGLPYVATGRTAAAGSNQVLRVRDGSLELVAGNGTTPASGDGGPATAAGIDPRAVAFDGAGNLYIADSANHRIRRVDGSGVISTFAGIGGQESGGCEADSGDGGPARAARICSPSDLAFDSAERLLVATRGAGALIRRIDAAGTISTIAGSGRCDEAWEFGAAAATTDFCNIGGIAVDARDNVYFSTIRGRAASYVARIDDASNVVTRAVGIGCEVPDGNGAVGCASGNGGPALLAGLNDASNLALFAGRLFVADTGNHAVRVVDPGGHLASVPGALAFGSQEIGVATAARLATFVSTGTVPVVIERIELAGSDAGDFILGGEDCSGRTLAPGAGCRAFVSFRPSDTGARSARLTVVSNAIAPPETPVATALTGTGIAVPRLRVTPNPVPFGARSIGTTTVKTVKLSSVASAAVTVGSISIVGGTSDDYTIAADGCSGATLSVGTSCLLDVSFTPLGNGYRNSTLRIPSNAAPAVLDVALIGSAGPLLQVTPLAIDFGGVRVGESSAARAVLVRSVGSDPLLVTSASPVGLHAPDFVRLSDGCTGIPIAPGGECELSYVFAPSAFGLRTAAADVRSNAATPSVVVAFSGTGLDAGAPLTSFETPDGAIVLGVSEAIRGSTIDASSGVARVEVTIDPLIGDTVRMSGGLSCNAARTACNWSVRLPLTLMGPATVHARARDAAGNVEAPGPTIGVIII